MSDINPWGARRETQVLHNAIDRLFDHGFRLPFDAESLSKTPAIDMYQTGEEVVVRAALPGLKVEELEISVFGDLLTLSGQFECEGEKQDTTHLHGQLSGSFEREIMLPSKVHSEKARGEFENGILTVRLPKAGGPGPRTIPVKSR